jgi:hypothetical protein
MLTAAQTNKGEHTNIHVFFPNQAPMKVRSMTQSEEKPFEVMISLTQ